jgi:phospholipase C
MVVTKITLLMALLCALATTSAQATFQTATPIEHLVIIFNENVSFDHYFATYPHAANPPGEPRFIARAGTPGVDNLATARLLNGNPNYTNAANGSAAADPFRLDRTQAATADQDHGYTPEQKAYDGGKADLFPKFTGRGTKGGAGAFGTAGQVMGYFDGNTVTALWEYAQHFAMSDNAYSDAYGPSTPGALEVVSGQTNGMRIVKSSKRSYYIDDGQGGYTMIIDVDPDADVCSVPNDRVMMTGKNIGDLLSAANLRWGSFMGGFDIGVKNANGTTGCKRTTHSTATGRNVPDYIPHHAWFQYYASTSNPMHARPSSIDAIGSTDRANHNYDLDDFYAALKAGNFPAVSYVKLPAFQDGHAGYSDPVDEQRGTVELVNFIEGRPEWKDTAIVILWDDSDGWYDHLYTNPTNASFDPQADQLHGPGKCGEGTPMAGVGGKPVNGRCGPGTRIPFIVVSPWARRNYVAHNTISQASVVRFIEDNWLGGERLGGGSFDATAGSLLPMFDFTRRGGHNAPLLLDPGTGEPKAST